MEQEKQQNETEWKWVIAGVIAGFIIVGASYYIVVPTFHSLVIQALIMMVGFAITGVIVGYFSPGVTIKEAGMGGGLVMLLMIGLLFATGTNEELIAEWWVNTLMLILGVGFSLVGGWAGEKLQEASESVTEHDKATDVIHWKWVMTGIVIGFALNIMFVFLTAPMFNLDLKAALVAFLFSFVITGFVVGYKSPGVTLREPVIAGALTVVIDWIFVTYGINLTVAVEDMFSGLALGLLFSLLGAWLGEKYQESKQASAG